MVIISFGRNDSAGQINDDDDASHVIYVEKQLRLHNILVAYREMGHPAMRHSIRNEKFPAVTEWGFKRLFFAKTETKKRNRRLQVII